MIDSLAHFALIVEHGTFTRAARHAHLSQPALSASIRRLEDWAGAPLLLRGHARTEPTAAGHALLPRARAVLTALDDARRAVTEVLGLERGAVRLAASATAATYLLPSVLARLRREHPGVRISLRELPPLLVHDAVAAGEVDLGVVGGPGDAAPFVAGPGVVVEPWRRDEFVLVGAPGTRGAQGPFVTFLPGTATRAALDRAFPTAEVVMELGSIAAIKRHVREGIGITLVSRAAVVHDLRARRLVLLRHPATPIARQLWLAHRGVERLSPACAALRALVLASRRAADHD